MRAKKGHVSFHSYRKMGFLTFSEVSRIPLSFILYLKLIAENVFFFPVATFFYIGNYGRLVSQLSLRYAACNMLKCAGISRCSLFWIF